MPPFGVSSISNKDLSVLAGMNDKVYETGMFDDASLYLSLYAHTRLSNTLRSTNILHTNSPLSLSRFPHFPTRAPRLDKSLRRIGLRRLADTLKGGGKSKRAGQRAAAAIRLKMRARQARLMAVAR